MSAKIIVGLDGGGPANLAVSHARKLAALVGDCELIVVYVIEWSPYSFQTPEENAERHRHREEEIEQALSSVVTPVVKALQNDGFSARGVVRHGNVAELLDRIAVDEGAFEIVVARASHEGLAEKVFGSTAEHLVRHANVPVTVVGQGIVQ